jgi:DNA-damage-inducible protein J
MKSATIRARIEPELKTNVENILVSLGLNTSDAITIFYKQIELHNGLPFKVEIPNAETIEALKNASTKQNLTECTDSQDMFNKLGI